MSAYSNSIYGQSASQASQFSPTPGMMPFSSGQFYSAPLSPAYSNPASVYQSHGSSVNTPQKSESKVDTASSTSHLNGNSHTLSGGVFNYGLSQHHSPLPFVSPMNFNPFSSPSLGHAASTPPPTTQPNPTNSMSYSPYGSDPYSYMGGPSGGWAISFSLISTISHLKSSTTFSSGLKLFWKRFLCSYDFSLTFLWKWISIEGSFPIFYTQPTFPVLSLHEIVHFMNSFLIHSHFFLISYGGFGNMAAGASPLQSVAGMPGSTPYSLSTNSPYSMMSSLMSMFPGMSSMGFWSIQSSTIYEIFTHLVWNDTWETFHRRFIILLCHFYLAILAEIVFSWVNIGSM